MTVLVVDHYDSFVYNLVQLVEGLGYDTEVVRSDAESVEDLVAREPAAVILSPGPGRPEEAGCFVALIGALPPEIPILGVCLGHQALGAAFGGSGAIDRAPEPVHGKTSAIRHDGTGLFEGVPDPFEAGRYHSLVIRKDAVPYELEVIATTDDGLVMGVRHREMPRFGVQFHPESILTPEGPRIVENFLR